MLKVLICCMGGFSSSTMVGQLQKSILEDHYDDKMTVEFHGFSTCFEVMDRFDIIMTCPHLSYQVPKFVQEHHPSIPIYVLPPKLYGSMTAEAIYDDAMDILEGYKKTGMNPFVFPGEEKTLHIKRRSSHRKWIVEGNK